MRFSFVLQSDSRLLCFPLQSFSSDSFCKLRCAGKQWTLSHWLYAIERNCTLSQQTVTPLFRPWMKDTKLFLFYYFIYFLYATNDSIQTKLIHLQPHATVSVCWREGKAQASKFVVLYLWLLLYSVFFLFFSTSQAYHTAVTGTQSLQGYCFSLKKKKETFYLLFIQTKAKQDLRL